MECFTDLVERIHNQMKINLLMEKYILFLNLLMLTHTDFVFDYESNQRFEKPT
jgi:hypothetical protein